MNNINWDLPLVVSCCVVTILLIITSHVIGTKKTGDRLKKLLYTYMYPIFFLIFCIPIIIYRSSPEIDQSIIGTSSDFANFGSFVGGVFTPILSFFAFIILMKTYREQKLELERRIKESKKQLFIERYDRIVDEFNDLTQSPFAGTGSTFEYRTDPITGSSTRDLIKKYFEPGIETTETNRKFVGQAKRIKQCFLTLGEILISLIESEILSVGQQKWLQIYGEHLSYGVKHVIISELDAKKLYSEAKRLVDRDSFT
jgi:hypothetical protein